jgi:hypothetical protein
MLKAFMNRLATPLTTGLFAVSTISGVALFFHWAPGAFHAMHEWLSILLLLPFAFHVWKNWNALLGYARRRTLLLPLAASLLVALPFAVSGMMAAGNRGGNPAFRVLPLLTQARLSELAPVLKTTPDALLANLKQRGHKADSTDATLSTVAAASGVPASELLIALLPAR